MILKYNEIEMERIHQADQTKSRMILVYRVKLGNEIIMFVTVHLDNKSVDIKYYADSNIAEENILDVFHTLYSWYFSLVFGFWHLDRHDTRIFNN